MSINMFEGGRRIRTIIAVITLLGCTANLIWGGGTPSLSLKTDVPGQPFRIVPDCADADELRHVGYNDVDGTAVSMNLCFETGADKTIAYKEAPGKPGFYYFGLPYDDEAAGYIAARISQVEAGKGFDRKAVAAAAQREGRRLFVGRIQESLVLLVGLMVALYGLTWCVGWVVRGFAGIPRGRDSKPAKPTALP